MTQAFTDALSHSNDHVKNVAEALRRSGRLLKVFKAIYKGKTNPKSVSQLIATTGMDRVGILQQGSRLHGLGVVTPKKAKGKTGRSETAYEKVRFWVGKKGSVLRLAANPKKLKEMPTKYAPKVTVTGKAGRVTVQGAKFQVSVVTFEDFDQFKKAKRVKNTLAQKISEANFKRGIQKLIGETGKYQDWGGERNDLYTSKLRYKGKRRPLAFAFKGPGTKGILTPKGFGKRGDQIQRLFTSPAEIFIVQYHGQFDEAVIEQMQGWARLKSIMEGRRIWYGVIDGDDTRKLLAAYPKQFGLKK